MIHINKSYVSTLLMLMIFIFSSCSLSRQARLRKNLNEQLSDEVYFNHFTGLMVMDPVDGKVLYQQNADRYFTPASNTKIITLFTAINTLPDSIPIAKYYTHKDSIILMPMGDPTQLHPYFKHSTLVKLVSNYNHALIYFDHFQDDAYGPGWAWEDYDRYFAPARSAMPLYGNVVRIHLDSIIPAYFEKDVVFAKSSVQRAPFENKFYHNNADTSAVEIPFIYTDSLSLKLLEACTKTSCERTFSFTGKNIEILYGLPSDSLYKRMMHESDNFLAEQMMILVSSMIGDTISVRNAIQYALDSLCVDIPQKPRWVDGSGLSRYNLITPRSLVYILDRMYQTIPQNQLFGFFPTGGLSGTLKDWYGGKSTPFVFAKSGSLGNNYNLSGYLISKSNKVLIFSFMNNHFRKSSQDIKSNIARVLDYIHESY